MKFYKKFYFVIIGIIVLYASFLFISDFNQVYDKLSNFKTDFLPIILLLTPCGWLVLFLRWNLLLKKSNISLPFGKNFQIYLTGFALGVTPGKIGELIKSQLYKEKFQIPRKTTIPIILVERIYNLIGLVIISFLGILFFEFSSIVIGAGVILIIIGFLFISNKKLFQKLLSLLNKIKYTKKYAHSISDSYEVVQRSTRGSVLLYSSLLSAVFWIIESMVMYFVFLSFEIDFLSFLQIISMYATSILLGAASFLPDGIGVMEGSLVGLLTLNDIDISTAFTLVISFRIFTLWYGIIAGFISLKIIGGFSSDTYE